MILVNDNTFYLHTLHTSYVVRILSNGSLHHVYYGARIPEDNMDYYQVFAWHPTGPYFVDKGEKITTDALPMECPGFGRGDFRRPALSVTGIEGRSVNGYLFKSYRIVKGKPKLEGLPQCCVQTEELQTLEIILEDITTGVEIICSYTTFDKEDVIARHFEIRNNTADTVQVESAASATIDFERKDFDMVSLSGGWARERHIDRRAIVPGETSISSRYGISGHHTNPFAALAAKDAVEDYGNVYGFSLIYSGNFFASAEVGPYGGTRFWMGIHPEMFSWELASGDSFTTPEILITFTEKGFGGMSRNFHTMCREHLGVCADKTKEHPVVLNLWEAVEFDISEEKLVKAIHASRDAGIDTLVIDDGWFGNRQNTESSLGDWVVNREKFPHGLEYMSDLCREYGMKLGLWFEPEMLSRDSDLFRAHPDWCIHMEKLTPTEIREQLVLDLSRPEVVEAVYETIAKVLRECGISYVKWDMNRAITDNGSSLLPSHRQKEHGHRQMLGVYELMRLLTENFPNVFFEGCAGGGGRFDFGELYYMPQVWTSDCTDAWERMLIQYGTSYVFPPETISAHVSDCPNFATARSISFQTRCDVASFFSYGYELDPCKFTDEERRLLVTETEKHKRITENCKGGQFYRLISPFTENACAWQLVSKDANYSAVFYGVKLREPNFGGTYFTVKGLNPEKRYRVEPLGITLSGATLMHAGIPIVDQIEDFHTWIFELIAE